MVRNLSRMALVSRAGEAGHHPTGGRETSAYTIHFSDTLFRYTIHFQIHFPDTLYTFRYTIHFQIHYTLSDTLCRYTR